MKEGTQSTKRKTAQQAFPDHALPELACGSEKDNGIDKIPKTKTNRSLRLIECSAGNRAGAFADLRNQHVKHELDAQRHGCIFEPHPYLGRLL